MRTSKSRLSKRTEHGPTDTYFAVGTVTKKFLTTARKELFSNGSLRQCPRAPVPLARAARVPRVEPRRRPRAREVLLFMGAF